MLRQTGNSRPWRASRHALHQHPNRKELLKRIELSTSSLPRKCSTPELQQPINSTFQIPNSKFGYPPDAKLIFNIPVKPGILNFKFIVSGKRGSNSRPIAWKAIALPTELLPLTYFKFEISDLKLYRGENRIRTCEDISQQIYSLSSLAA